MRPYFNNPPKKKVIKKVTKKVPVGRGAVSKKKVATKKSKALTKHNDNVKKRLVKKPLVKKAKQLPVKKKTPTQTADRPKPAVDTFYLQKVAKFLAEAQLHKERTGKVLPLTTYATDYAL